MGYSRVMKGINRVQFHAKCQGLVGDLIKVLLKREPSERLPMRPGGVKNLKEHEFYRDFDWIRLRTERCKRPTSLQSKVRRTSPTSLLGRRTCQSSWSIRMTVQVGTMSLLPTASRTLCCGRGLVGC